MFALHSFWPGPRVWLVNPIGILLESIVPVAIGCPANGIFAEGGGCVCLPGHQPGVQYAQRAEYSWGDKLELDLTSGSGGRTLSHTEGKTAEECKAHCEALEECECVTVSPSGDCWTLAECVPEEGEAAQCSDSAGWTNGALGGNVTCALYVDKGWCDSGVAVSNDGANFNYPEKNCCR